MEAVRECAHNYALRAEDHGAVFGDSQHCGSRLKCYTGSCWGCRLACAYRYTFMCTRRYHSAVVMFGAFGFSKPVDVLQVCTLVLMLWAGAEGPKPSDMSERRQQSSPFCGGCEALECSQVP